MGQGKGNRGGNLRGRLHWEAFEHLKKAYEGQYRVIENLPEKESADYGDLAKQEAERRTKAKAVI